MGCGGFETARQRDLLNQRRGRPHRSQRGLRGFRDGRSATSSTNDGADPHQSQRGLRRSRQARPAVGGFDAVAAAKASVLPATRSLAASLTGLLAAVLLPLSAAVRLDARGRERHRHLRRDGHPAGGRRRCPGGRGQGARARGAAAGGDQWQVAPAGHRGARRPRRPAGRGRPHVPHRVGRRPTAPRTSSWSPSSRTAAAPGSTTRAGSAIDLDTVFGAIAQNLAAQGLVDADAAADIDASFAVMVDAGQLAKARTAYDALDTLGFWLPLVWVATVLLTLLLAHRRLASAAKLAVASLVTMGLLALVLLFARDALTEDLPAARRRPGGLARLGREPCGARSRSAGRAWRWSPWWRRCWPECSDAEQRRPGRTRTAPAAVGLARLRSKRRHLGDGHVDRLRPRHHAGNARRRPVGRHRAIHLGRYGTSRTRFPPKQQGPHLVFRLS